MEFLLRDGKGKDFLFPVNPEEVTISRQKGLDTVNILSSGEFDFPQGDKVKEISFASFFPKTFDGSFCRGSKDALPDPQTAMNKLNEFLALKTPLRFIISETAVNVLRYLWLRIIPLFAGGEPGDVYFEITLRTWRELKVAKTVEAAARERHPRLTKSRAWT